MAERAVPRTENLASRLPVYPFLFAFYPVARLYEENKYEVSLGDVLGPLLAVMGLTAVGFAALAFLVGEPRRAALVTTAIVLPVMLFGLLHELAEPMLGDVRAAFVIIAIVVALAAAWLAIRLEARLGSVTLGLNVLSLVLVALAIVPAMQGAAAEVDGDGEPAGLAEADVTIQANGASDRDIYHLVLDRYGSEASLRAGPGLDNGVFMDWLRDHGFDVVDHAYANYTKTLLSLASTLGMELLDAAVAEAGPESADLDPLELRIRRSRAGRFLRSQGYEYVHLGSWFLPTRESDIADRSFHPAAEVSFASTLYDLSIFPFLLQGPSEAVDNRRRHADAARYQFDRLERLTRRPGRTYVLAHILLPHPPYVFLEDGTYDPGLATLETQLGYVNARLRRFLQPLLALPEPERPIIVLQADEGPYPDRWDEDRAGFDWATASDPELLTKFGILSAIYLPGPEGVAPLRDDMTAVNTYPELFRRYFGAALPDQPDRVMASNEARPYDLIDVTARLRAQTPGG